MRKLGTNPAPRRYTSSCICTCNIWPSAYSILLIGPSLTSPFLQPFAELCWTLYTRSGHATYSQPKTAKMVSTQEQKKFYLRSPDLEYNLNGPIQIGNVVTDMKYPQDPIATLSPMSAIVTGSGYGDGKLEHEGHASLKLSLAAKIYEVFGGQAEARTNNSLRTTYEFDEIEAQYLQRNPTKADAQMLQETNQEVKGALMRGPVYVVTGLKIAKGLRYSNRRTADHGGKLVIQSHVTKEASLGGALEGERGGEDIESYTVIGDPILAYRLHIIKREGFRWLKEREIEVKSVEHGKAGFMNRSAEAEEDDGVEVAEVTLQDVQYFVEDEEYDEVERVDLTDGRESWSLLSILLE